MENYTGILFVLSLTISFLVLVVILITRRRRPIQVEKIHSDDGIATEVGEHKKVNEDEQETTQPSTDETEQSLVDRETCVKPVSVNYHFTRQCNYSCGFCFHTAKTSFVLPIDQAKRGLQMLKEKGMYYYISFLV
jgi:2-iminoacetate synthase ThiH